ncbi:hypothetical protein FHL15_003951 [Xylaria flabelliformis]|uniref:Uncharacterized protein n=1 Tax=Xylaria flabelliformis TaxID=2512241 RepID=A0A553I4X5_9PEZI|nr:hypothetical protein FHL15_003951 [Xylaria flabelliformis]
MMTYERRDEFTSREHGITLTISDYSTRFGTTDLIPTVESGAGVSSVHSPDTLLEPTRPALDPDVEEAVLNSINLMLGAVVDELGHVWELPHLVHTSPSSLPPIEIMTTERHEFYLLPAPDFMMLHMVHASIRHEDTLLKDAFAAPTEYYAGLDDGADSEFLLRGKIMRRSWSAAAFLISTSRRRGCIINQDRHRRPAPHAPASHAQRAAYAPGPCSRSLACVRAVEREESSSMAQTVFVLSPTFPQARVLEARMEARPVRWSSLSGECWVISQIGLSEMRVTMRMRVTTAILT